MSNGKVGLTNPVIEITEATNSESGELPIQQPHLINSFHPSRLHSPEPATHTLSVPELFHPSTMKKNRSSSVSSTAAAASLERYMPGGAMGLPRERCRRTQSVNRRRASTRMSTTGHELSYMVRWIIGEYSFPFCCTTSIVLILSIVCFCAQIKGQSYITIKHPHRNKSLFF